MTNKIAKILAVIAAAGGLAVMIGWIFDITVLKSVSPQFVTMKFITAVCFLLSGVTLYCVAEINKNKQEWPSIVLIFVDFLIILMSASLIISIFTGIKTGMEDIFIKEPTGAIKTTVPGRPALVTLIDFALIAGIGLLNLCRKTVLTLRVTHILGIIITASGALAIIGYLTDIPQLYGHFNNISTAMALHTAALFVLLGVGFFILKDGNDGNCVLKL